MSYLAFCLFSLYSTKRILPEPSWSTSTSSIIHQEIKQKDLIINVKGLSQWYIKALKIRNMDIFIPNC